MNGLYVVNLLLKNQESGVPLGTAISLHLKSVGFINPKPGDNFSL